MISREWAIALVERKLTADWEADPAARRALLGQPMVITGIDQHPLGWLISFNSKQYAESGDRRDAWIGQGPYLVDGLDGSLHMVHMQFCSGGLKWEDQYRQKIRGEIPSRELDTEVRRLLGLGRRFDAFKAVRRAGDGLTPAEARRVLDALGAGLEPPEDLAARLPQPDRSYRAISTYTGPNPEPESPDPRKI
jgi:Immunity protein 35